MRSDKKTPLRSDKKSPPKIQKKGTLGYNKKSALLEDAITQMNAGKYGRASSALKDLLALDPLNAEARRLFATLHLRLGSLLSARTAFESLAREAMERQDYWLAESLLREYLTAGPRCVLFLDMLGRVYEEKGDVMGAVAEYGKAVEVLLEDPDSDHPNRASELFGKIRSLAPGSPVAFRFAAMFDTVTGQIIQAPSAPGGEGASRDPSPLTASISESTIPTPAAVAMPWEQMESTASDVPLALGAGDKTTGESTETVDAPSRFGSLESAREIQTTADPSDLMVVPQGADSPISMEVELPRDAASESGVLWAGPNQILSEQARLVDDSAPPTPTGSEYVKPTTEELTQQSNQLITAKPLSSVPMPWDQVEDDSPAVHPALAGEISEAAVVSQPRAIEADLCSPPAAEGIAHSVTVIDEPSRFPIVESLTGSAPLSPQQEGEVLSADSRETDSRTASGAEMVSFVSGAADYTSPPIVESASPTIEVLRTSSAHPITEAPVTPAPMPWDQEMPPTSLSAIDSDPITEVKLAASETVAASSPVDAGSMADAPAEPASSFISSSGLSWEDILAAVTAMQSSPAFPPAQPTTERESTTDIAVPDEGAETLTPRQDPSGTGSIGLLGLVEHSPALSDPMPWEQVEVEEVAILRPDPEPEFGPISGEVLDVAQDSTVLTPLADQMHTEMLMAAPIADDAVTRELNYAPSSATMEFRKQSSEAPETIESTQLIGELEPVAEGETASPLNRTLEVAGEQCLRLAVSDLSGSPKSDERVPFAGSSAEAVEMVPLEMLPPSAQTEQPTALAFGEPATEAAEPSLAPAFVADQPIVQLDPVAAIPEIIRIAEDVEPASESKRLLRSEKEPIAISNLPSGHAATSIQSETIVSPTPVLTKAALPGLECSLGQSAAASDVCVPDSLASKSIESAPAIDADVPPTSDASDADLPTQAATPTASLATSAGNGLHILWDDSSSKPIPSVSTGNLLTRWLRRPAQVASPEADPVAAGNGEPESPVMSTPVEAQEAKLQMADVPINRSIEVTPPLDGQSPTRPKPTKRVVRQAWGHLSRTVASLIGAGVSTTRSITVLVVALLGLTAALLAGCGGILALTWLILEEQPTPVYRTMTSVPQHSLQDSQKNGYFLLLGFGAAPTQDPVQAGIDRRAEQADRALSLTCLTGEGNGVGSVQGASADVVGKWLKSVDPADQMRLESAGVKSWVLQAGVAMGRYRQWLSKPFEDWGYGEPVSPNCGMILYAHRLYVAEGFGQDVDAGVARLETDLTAWRTVFGQAKTMPVKMLAGDALNDDVAVVSGLLLRPGLDDRLISRLAKLVRPLDENEQSIRWPMQSQFVVATRTLDAALNHDPTDTRPVYGSIAAALPLPKQRRFNAYAQYYEAVSKAAAEGRYADLPKQSQFMRTPPFGVIDVVVNPIESLAGIEPLPTWETFGARVLETDARLRLASLQAWLRRTPPEQDLLTRVAKAGQGLYDPFTGYPMLVNMKKGLFYSVGRDMKDDDAQARVDIVAQIPPTASAGGTRAH